MKFSSIKAILGLTIVGLAWAFLTTSCSSVQAVVVEPAQAAVVAEEPIVAESVQTAPAAEKPMVITAEISSEREQPPAANPPVAESETVSIPYQAGPDSQGTTKQGG
jgi:uncharacterized protein YcfL